MWKRLCLLPLPHAAFRDSKLRQHQVSSTHPFLQIMLPLLVTLSHALQQRGPPLADTPLQVTDLALIKPQAEQSPSPSPQISAPRNGGPRALLLNDGYTFGSPEAL